MSQKILIVDDSPQIRVLLEIFLRKKGFQTLQAANAADALEVVKNDNDIDLVILDNRMPGTQGIDIVNTLRELKKGVRILLLTGSISSEHKSVEVDAFMRKPVDLYKLLDSINSLLGQG